MRSLATIFLICWCSWLPAQVHFEKTHHDFGDVGQGHDRVVDFKMTNRGFKKVFILRAGTDPSHTIQFSTKVLEPDSSGFVRVKIHPKKKGSYRQKIPLYLSNQNDPVNLVVSGQIKHIEQNDTPCPDFSKVRPYARKTLELTVQVKDMESREAIENAEVIILRAGFPYQDLETNRRGLVKKPVLLGPYYFIVQAEGYKPTEFPAMVEDASTFIPVELEPLRRPEPIVVEVPPATPEPDVEIPPSTNPPDIDPVPVPISPDTVPDDPEAFTEANFAPNNVVFLIDVSYSMKRDGRLDLLKASMVELLDLLRDVDRVSIVTYASESHVILPSTSAAHKEEIATAIRELKAGGNTAGNKGISKAFEIAQQNFIPGGNNEIFIATDGRFDVTKERGGVIDVMKRNEDSGVSLSVIGMKNITPTVESMQLIAELGHGQYIRIGSYEEARVILTKTIKDHSRKG